jgi:RNA polymerase sigma-70 factor (ECF subfamily)
VSETFLVAWRRWDDAPTPDRRLPWLYGIAYRNLSNMRRSRDRQHRLEMRLTLERDFTDEADDKGVSVAHVQRAIARLRVSDRELLEFVYWEKLTYRDIATIIGISENAVGIRVNRARKHLRSILSLSTDDVANPNRREEFES